jgi:hypothetical protein
MQHGVEWSGVEWSGVKWSGVLCHVPAIRRGNVPTWESIFPRS